MVNWSDPSTVATQQAMLDEIDMIMFGVMLWEVLVTLHFDIAVLRGRAKFVWTMLIYFATKYATLAFVTACLVFSVEVTKKSIPTPPIDCQALSYFTNLSLAIGVSGASALLMLRAVALWGRDLRVSIPLVILNLGQLGLYLHGGFITVERWGNVGDDSQGYVVLSSSTLWTAAQFIYSMSFDFIVLALATYSLVQHAGGTKLSDFGTMLFRDGMVYFLVAFLSYLACTIVNNLGISPSLTFMISDPAIVIVSILACRSYVRVFNTRLGSRESRPRSQESTGTAFKFSFSRPKRTVPLTTRLTDLESNAGWSVKPPSLNGANAPADDSAPQVRAAQCTEGEP